MVVQKALLEYNQRHQQELRGLSLGRETRRPNISAQSKIRGMLSIIPFQTLPNDLQSSQYLSSYPQIYTNQYLFLLGLNRCLPPYYRQSKMGAYNIYMSIIFSVKNQYYKNGMFWFTKIANKIMGEATYDKLRMKRRIYSMLFYYQRQQYLHKVFMETPDVACLWGIYPKVDTSHGFGSPVTYEMYRDFQENTINSDGSFGMWIAYCGGIYLVHVIYTYIYPFSWRYRLDPSRISGGEEFYRLKDALSTTIFEDTIGLQYAEYAFNPHDFQAVRSRLQQSMSGPDDVRAMHMGSLNRKNRYAEHYMKRAGDQRHMVIGS